TFHGPNRTGAEEAKHLHEVSPVMWIPLVLLAVLSVFGGWINVPPDIQSSFLGGFGALPMGEWLHHWLEPVTAGAVEVQLANLGEVAHSAPFGGSEFAWALTSTILAAIVVVAAARYIGSRPVVPARDDIEPTGFGKVLYNKWYVDEIYDRIVVQPIVRASRFAWKIVDATIIDGVVN